MPQNVYYAGSFQSSYASLLNRKSWLAVKLKSGSPDLNRNNKQKMKALMLLDLI